MNTTDSQKAWPKVAIIVLNWNGWRDTIECLESLYQITYPNYEVIVVDNGSTDNSISQIKQYCEGTIKIYSDFFNYCLANKPIKIVEYTRNEAENGIINFNRRLIIIKNEKNYGFAEGNNIAMRYALRALHPDYLLLLNNDTVVESRFLEELVSVGESNEKIGIVGPKVCYYAKPNRIQSAGVMLRWNTGGQEVLGSNEIDTNQFEEIYDVDYVTGCALLVKAELIEKIGYLKPEYFAYWEETDWCIRACKAGYRVLCSSKSKIWHKGASTSGKISGFHVYYMTRNMFWFMREHATRWQYTSFLLFFLVFRFWFKTGIYLTYHRDINSAIAFFRGFRDGINRTH